MSAVPLPLLDIFPGRNPPRCCRDQKSIHNVSTSCPVGLKCLVPGCLSSAFTLAAIWRSSARQHPTVIYQTAWIVANCLTLVLGCGLDWVTHVTGQPTVNSLADWTCRIWQAMFGVIRYIGGWTVVAMLVERYLTNRGSQLVKDYCSPCYVKVILRISRNDEAILVPIIRFFLLKCLQSSNTEVSQLLYNPLSFSRVKCFNQSRV